MSNKKPPPKVHVQSPPDLVAIWGELQEMKELLSKEFKDSQEVAEKGLEFLREEFAQLKKQIKKIDDVTEQCVTLRKENAKKDQQIKVLFGRVEELDQTNKANEVIITGMAIRHSSYASAAAASTEGDRERRGNETVESQVLSFLKDKGFNINREMVDSCYLLPRKRGEAESGTRAVLVKFLAWKHKAALLKQGRLLKGSRVFINENLTKGNATIAWKARELKRNKKIQATWSSNGRILITPNGALEGSRPVLIRDMEELAKYE